MKMINTPKIQIMNNWLLTPLQAWGGSAPVSYDTPLALTFVIVFFVLMVGIGLFAGRYQSDEVEYYVAGRRSGIFVIAISSFAAIASGWGFVGTPGSIYASGLEFMIMNFAALGFVIAYWLLAKKMRLLGTLKNAVSAPDALYYRFGESDHVRLLGAISIFLGCMGYLAAQYAAMGIIGSIVLPFGFIGSLIIGMGVVAFYTIIGGSLAAIWSDAIQGVIMALSGPILFFYIVAEVDMDLNSMVSAVVSESPNWFNMSILGGESIAGIGFALSALFLTITVAGQPQLITKFYMIRDVSLLKWGALISGVGYLLTMVYWFAVPWIKAGTATGQFPTPSNPDYALPIALVQSAPGVVVAFILTAILAAIMSTSNAFLNLAAASIQHDIIQEYFSYELTNKQQVAGGRITTLIVLIAAFAIAATYPDIILVLGAAGWALMASVLLPGITIAYNWKNATREGIVVGGWTALIGTLVMAFGAQYLEITLPLGILGGQAAGFVGLLLFVVVSLFTSTAEFSDLSDEHIKEIIDIGRLGDDDQSTEASVPSDD
jgi:sodium/proline symporter